jgi:hypothetical protein
MEIYMKKIILITLVLFIPVLTYSKIKNVNGKTISQRFSPPKGYKRITTQNGSFENYLQNFSLLSDKSNVYFFNGAKKFPSFHDAVLNIDVGKKDLQQCADAVMRLRAEYLYALQKDNQISFDLTNGFSCNFSKWKQGYRVKVKGNKTWWVKKYSYNRSRKTFISYMTFIFSYAGTYSLSKQLRRVSANDIKIGDVFIQGGFPGHAIIVVDLAKNSKGEKIMLLAQSYMPAQSIHIIKNPASSFSPWYKINTGARLVTPEWIFNFSDLKRF